MADLTKKPFCLSPDQISKIRSLIDTMTLDEKVGQLFCMVTYASSEEDVKKLVDNVHPGAIMYRPMSAEEAVKETSYFKKHSRIPMLIAANLEAGGNGIVKEGTKVGSEMQLGATQNPGYARVMGEIAADEGAAVGANWAFAPIVDIDFNFRNPITNTRTFGSNPDLVASMGVEYIKAVQSRGVAASFKHFPGDGVDERDQHLVTNVNSFDFDHWMRTYGKVYKACIDAGALTCMVGHIVLPDFIHRFHPEIKDGDILPGSLSPELIQDLLKSRLGFNGLVVTDATTMAGMCSAMPRDKLVPQAIKAGADMFLFTRNMEEDVRFMKEGILNGTITPERLEEALTTILGLKMKLGLFDEKRKQPELSEALKIVSKPESKKWAREVAERSITLVKNNQPGVLPISPKKYPRVLVYSLEAQKGFAYSVRSGAVQSFINRLEKEGFKVSIFDDKMGYEGRLLPESWFTDNFDLIIYVANIATKSNQTTVRIEWALPMGINVPIMYKTLPTIFISLENPYHLLDVPRVPIFINTYSSTEETLDALVEKLTGRSVFEGIAPSDPFCGKWDTHL